MELIQPVIVRANHQRQLVENLARYCQSLDGTSVKIIDAQSTLPYPHCNNAEFANASRVMAGKPFIWMEPDSIPLKRGWIKQLTEDFLDAGKPFLLSADSNPPHDLIGGIGVYGPETRWLIPASFPRGGWDGWMINHVAPLISRTKKIQHSYGIYDEHGNATPHRFLFNRSLVRHNAVIFHRDKFQDLTRNKVGKHMRFYHTGDLGDIIAALPIIRSLGGGDLIIGNHNPLHDGWRKMEGDRYAAIAPLLAAQPYISSVTFEHGAQNIDIDFSRFRTVYRKDRSLTENQARFLGLPTEPDLSPWLTVAPSEAGVGKIVVARSQRYHNLKFPWQEIAFKNFNRLLFAGTREEHADFCYAVGRPVGYAKTANLMALARLIKGCDIFIGNQSCPCWIAMGLGARVVQETHPEIRDSIIQIPNAFFCDNGHLSEIEKLGVL